MGTDSLDERLAEVDAMLARGAPYSEVLAELDACMELSGSEEASPGIEHRRLTVLRDAGVPEEEVESALERFLVVESEQWRRGAATLAVCAAYPGIASRRLHLLIVDLESLADRDPVAEKVLSTAYDVRARFGSKALDTAD